MTTKIEIKPDPDSLQASILALCERHEMGVTQEILGAEMPETPFKALVPELNKLQASGKIEVLQTANKNLVWKLKDQAIHEKMKGLDVEEQLVFQAIQNAGSKGATTKIILDETKVPRNKLSRIVRGLIKKQRVKETNAPTGYKQKVYLAFDVEPSAELSWGSFYSGEANFEEEYVEILRNQCSLYLENKAAMAENHTELQLRRKAASVSVTEIHQHINSLKISTVPLSLDDIMTIMNCLVNDGMAERRLGVSEQQKSSVDLDDTSASIEDAPAADNVFYSKAIPLIEASGLAKIPCGACPVRFDCRPGGLISPEGCEYMKEFLSF